jgi:ankyrin repeat protein
MLLEREDIRPNTADKDGRTALIWASFRGVESAVEMLLKRHDTQLAAADRHGKTAYDYALLWYHPTIARLILEHPKRGVTSESPPV